MKTPSRFHFLAVILLVSCTLGVAQQNSSPTNPTEALPENWKIFSSPEAGFSIEFPGDPVLGTDGSAAEGAVLYKCTLTTRVNYGVIYADYPAKIDGPSAANHILDNGAKTAVASVNSELLSISEINVDGYPGRLLKEQMRNGSVMRAKMVLVGQRLYQVAITIPDFKQLSSAELSVYETASNRFLDSFKLLSDDQLGEVDRWLRANGGMSAVYGVCLPDDDDCGGESTSLVKGRGLVLAKPQYPTIARLAHASGTVAVRVIIDEKGDVMAAQVRSGHPLLYGVSVQAARDSHFSPTTVNGKPVKVTGILEYHFIAQN